MTLEAESGQGGSLRIYSGSEPIDDISDRGVYGGVIICGSSARKDPLPARIRRGHPPSAGYRGNHRSHVKGTGIKAFFRAGRRR